MVKVDIQQEELSARDREMSKAFSAIEKTGDSEISEEESKETQPANLLVDFERSKPLRSFMKDRMKSLPAFKGRKRSEITDEEIQTELTFARETDGYKNLLMYYFQAEGNPLRYDPSRYSKEFIDELEDYWDFIVYERRVSDRHGPEVKHENDLERSRRHMRVARQLFRDGMVPNEKVARLIVHFLSIDKGYDNLDFYRDENRRALTL